ncbi:MAG: thioesterase family protein [Gammaproteobacteria bacterium]|nr:thioesterase family protein [Gammaproteobacteria bacterium]
MTDIDKQSEANLKDSDVQKVNPENGTDHANKHWTGAINLALASTEDNFSEIVFNQLCKVFNKSPFFHHCGMKMRVVDGEIKGFVDMDPSLIGNVAFQILHGGVAATLLDSIGGIVAMGEIYCHGKGELKDRIRQVARLATTDMRVDYLSPGRGTQFIATAETLRMGRKGCTMRMNLHNQDHKLIATATASYVY